MDQEIGQRSRRAGLWEAGSAEQAGCVENVAGRPRRRPPSIKQMTVCGVYRKRVLGSIDSRAAAAAGFLRGAMLRDGLPAGRGSAGRRQQAGGRAGAGGGGGRRERCCLYRSAAAAGMLLLFPHVLRSPRVRLPAAPPASPRRCLCAPLESRCCGGLGTCTARSGAAQRKASSRRARDCPATMPNAAPRCDVGCRAQHGRRRVLLGAPCAFLTSTALPRCVRQAGHITDGQAGADRISALAARPTGPD